jgi:opacity protein-like surface antigen
MTIRRAWCALWLAVVCFPTAVEQARAEYYVAGQIGVNFADRLNDIQGTGSLVTLQPISQSFDLKNAVLYGGKLGFFPGNGAMGLELDVFNSQPNIKAMGDIPGIHLRVTNVGLNLMLRYPGQTFQPYVGFGGAALISHISKTVDVQSDTDVGFGINLLAGLRAFITPYVAVFTEYKYTRGTLTFSEAFGSIGGFSGDYLAQQVVVGVSYHF